MRRPAFGPRAGPPGRPGDPLDAFPPLRFASGWAKFDLSLRESVARLALRASHSKRKVALKMGRPAGDLVGQSKAEKSALGHSAIQSQRRCRSAMYHWFLRQAPCK
jgi:hypothetical protein